MLKVNFSQLLTAHSLADNAGHTWAKLSTSELYALKDAEDLVDLEDVNSACIARQLRVYGHDDISDWGVTAPTLHDDNLVFLEGYLQWRVMPDSEVRMTLHRAYREPDLQWAIERLRDGWGLEAIEGYIDTFASGVPIIDASWLGDASLGYLKVATARERTSSAWLGFSNYHVDIIVNALNAIAGPSQAARAVAHLYNRA